MLIHRRPTPGRYGSEIVILSRHAGANPLTANATTAIKFGGLHRRAVFLRITASAGTVPADADGTILARGVITATDGTANRDVSADIDLESLTANVTKAADRKAGLADSAVVIKPGETFRVNVVNNSAAIDTQPVDLVVTAEFALID